MKKWLNLLEMQTVCIMNVTGKMSNVSCWKNSLEFRAIVEAGSFSLFTMEVQVQFQGSPYGVSNCGRLFSYHFDFSLAFMIPPLLYTPMSSGACTVDPFGDATQRDLVLLHCCCNWSSASQLYSSGRTDYSGHLWKAVMIFVVYIFILRLLNNSFSSAENVSIIKLKVVRME